MYALCFNMEEFLDATLNVDCAEYIKFWLDAIHLHAPRAAVLLIGTHGDVVKDRCMHEDISHRLEAKLRTHLSFPFICRDGALLFFAINNKAPDQTTTRLRKALEDAATQLTVAAPPLPRLWLRILDAALEASNTRMPWPAWCAWTAQFGLGESQTKVMSRRLHQIGLLLFFDQPVLSNIVILDVPWLLDHITVLLRDSVIHSHPSDENMRFHAPGFLEELQTKGLLHEELLALAWPDMLPDERMACVGIMQLFHLCAPMRPISQATDILMRFGSRASGHCMLLFSCFCLFSCLFACLLLLSHLNQVGSR